MVSSRKTLGQTRAAMESFKKRKRFAVLMKGPKGERVKVTTFAFTAKQAERFVEFRKPGFTTISSMRD